METMPFLTNGESDIKKGSIMEPRAIGDREASMIMIEKFPLYLEAGL